MEGPVPSGSPQVLPEAFVRRMQQRVEELMAQVMGAVNQAPDGAWINASEMKVRDVFADLRREAYEMALQMRLDVTQAAFSPGGPSDGAAAVEQGS